MNESQRFSKQVVILIVFLLIVGGVAFGGKKIFTKPLPTPTPNPLANLLNISVLSTQLFNVQGHDYDFLAKVSNPNNNYGSGDVQYVLTFYNPSGGVASSKTGSFYILPGQTKYIVDSPLRFFEQVTRADFKIVSVDWSKLDQLAANGIPLIVRDASYYPVKEGGIFGKVGGEIVNDSDFDLNEVTVTLVLLNQNQTPVAINKTLINTFLAHTTRGFEVSWIAPFVGQVISTYVQASTNPFENSNFLRQYGGQEKFKQLY